MSAFQPVKTDETDSFLRAFKADTKFVAERYDVVALGDSVEMADELLALTLAGIKRATAALARDFGEGREPLPAPSATTWSSSTGASSRAASGGRRLSR